MDRTFKVYNKGLFGKDEVPMIKLKSEIGERLSIRLIEKSQLKDYPIDTILNVKIAKEQTTIA